MVRKWILQKAIGLVIILVLLTGCETTQVEPTGPSIPAEPTTLTTFVATSELPSYWPTDGWQTSTPEEQGMDSEKLTDMLTFIQDEDYNIDSVTIVRNGYLVTDANFYPFQPDSKHIIHSCTKSVVSALIGIAIEQGYM